MKNTPPPRWPISSIMCGDYENRTALWVATVPGNNSSMSGSVLTIEWPVLLQSDCWSLTKVSPAIVTLVASLELLDQSMTCFNLYSDKWTNNCATHRRFERGHNHKESAADKVCNRCGLCVILDQTLTHSSLTQIKKQNKTTWNKICFYFLNRFVSVLLIHNAFMQMALFCLQK